MFGRRVLVTGTSGGIEGATVRQLVAAGADVVASGRSEEALSDLSSSAGCRILPFELPSEDSIHEVLEGLDLRGVPP
jgi:NADP-dependent 3-hydroxy acid dehydrogenase YdfG